MCSSCFDVRIGKMTIAEVEEPINVDTEDINILSDSECCLTKKIYQASNNACVLKILDALTWQNICHIYCRLLSIICGFIGISIFIIFIVAGFAGFGLMAINENFMYMAIICLSMVFPLSIFFIMLAKYTYSKSKKYNVNICDCLDSDDEYDGYY